MSMLIGWLEAGRRLAERIPYSLVALVGMVGGLGGFLLPIMFGALLDWIEISSSCFMLMYGIVSVSLMLYYLTEVRRYPLLGEDEPETMLQERKPLQ